MVTTFVAAALAAAWLGAAQDRPTEEELFGPPPTAEPKAGQSQERPATPPAQPGQEPRPSEAEIFGGSGSPNAQPPPPEATVSREREDPLRIGGQIYLRALTQWQQGVAPADWYLTSPNLLDLYADVRPNDRVRGFVLGRLSYDPTLTPAPLPGVPAPPAALVALSPTVANPRAVLDQLWINFDLGRTVFVTAGKQHVKWGVGHFWNPTDYLHPVRRDPLAVFDERAGTTMVKLHLPWEARGWNLYGVGMFDDVAGTTEPTSRLGRLAVGGRGEIVLGTVELGADALTQDGHRPRFGVDVSAGIWDFDVYAEAALRKGTDAPRWRVDPAAPPESLGYSAFQPEGFTPFYVVGGSWSRNYSDEDAVTVGAEWAWNDAGYEDPSIYPFLLAGAPELTGDPANPIRQRDPRAYRPFYLGRQYAGAFVSLPKPGSWNDTTFTLSVLGNLSDRSFVGRLDHSVLALTYLRVETFAAVSFGHEGGEFRLGFDLPPPISVSVPPPILQLGVALRVSL
jgi:hypothetical protein